MKAIARQPDQSTTAELLEARADIKRLVGTLEALLDIAASKADRGDWKGMNPVDFSSTVRQICELYQDSAEDAGYHLKWEIAEDVIVLGDEAQLRRIVTNLLDNAFKYNRPGGDITVSLQAGPRLSVVDQGPGIPAAEREKVFERFYRGTTAASGTQGSGMGLALARAIAQRHGLSLGICDDEGGARFVLTPGEGSECV